MDSPPSNDDPLRWLFGGLDTGDRDGGGVEGERDDRDVTINGKMFFWFLSPCKSELMKEEVPEDRPKEEVA